MTEIDGYEVLGLGLYFEVLPVGRKFHTIGRTLFFNTEYQIFQEKSRGLYPARRQRNLSRSCVFGSRLPSLRRPNGRRRGGMPRLCRPVSRLCGMARY